MAASKERYNAAVTAAPGLADEAGNSHNGDSNRESVNDNSAGQMRSAASPPIQTEAELLLVKRHILLGIIIQILNHDIRVIDAAGMKFPRLYESMLRAIQDRVLLDLAHTRRLFREHGIKVYEEKRKTDGLHAKYICRGYHHHFFMLWGFIKAESERMLKQYISLSS